MTLSCSLLSKLASFQKSKKKESKKRKEPAVPMRSDASFIDQESEKVGDFA